MIIFTGRTARDYWRWRMSTSEGEIALRRHRIDAAPASTPRMLDAILESESFRNELPVEVMVADKRYSCRHPHIRCVQRSGRFPFRSFCRINKSVSVVGPELLFLELASYLDETDLIRMGCELTSSFHRDACGSASLVQRTPLTNIGSIRTYLSKMDGYRGTAKAKRALERVLERAASPQEIRLGLLLSLPRRLGGFGLPAPALNHEMSIDKKRCVSYYRSSVRFDLYWPKGSLDVEYDSDTYHSSPEKLREDSERRNAINRHGIDVITVTKRELASSSHMADIARTISERIGYRLPAIDLLQMGRIAQLSKRLNGPAPLEPHRSPGRTEDRCPD